MVRFYKNFLIVKRDEPNVAAAQYVAGIGLAFDDDARVWHFKSGDDEIIVVYPTEIMSGNAIDDECKVDVSTISPVGYFKLYSNGANVKVFDVHFPDSSTTEKYLLMLKNFLIATIKAAGATEHTYGDTKFTLYWDYKCYTKELDFVLQKTGLVTDLNKKTFVFDKRVVFPGGFGGWGASAGRPNPFAVANSVASSRKNNPFGK